MILKLKSGSEIYKEIYTIEIFKWLNVENMQFKANIKENAKHTADS